MDELLIEKVKQHELLYNHKCADYRDPTVRQAAWNEIGRHLQISGIAAKHHWDKLRRCLCNAISRRRDDPSSKKCLWKYEKEMSFVIPFIERRKLHGLSKKSVAKSEVGKEELSEYSESEEIIPPESEQEDFGTINIKTEDVTQEETCGDPLTKRPRLIGHQENNKQTEKVPKTVLETLDDTDMFFLSMSRMTKKLPRAEQAQIKLALSNSVLWAEMRCHQHSFVTNLYPQNTSQRNLSQQQSVISSPSPVPSNVEFVHFDN